MEEALVARLRGSTGVEGASGVFEDRPSIDVMERRSDKLTSFPATIIQKVSPGRNYDQDGPSNLSQPRVRLECFGTDYASVKLLVRAIIAELEQPAVVGGIRFHRGKLQFERDFPPEDLGGNIKIFRTVLDFFLPFTPE